MTMSTPILGVAPNVAPTVAPATAPTPAGAPDTGEVFLALVQGLLDATTGQPADPAATKPVADVPTNVATDTADDTDPTDLASEVAAAGVLPAPIVPSPLVQVAAAPAVVVTAPVVTASVVAAAPDAPTVPIAPATPTVTPLASPKLTSVPADPGEAPEQDPDTPAAAAPPPPADPPPADPAPTDPAPTDPAPTIPAPTVPAPTTPAPTAPVTSAGAPAAVVTTPAAPSDVHRVSHQVFPEVVRIVANPDGPRRVTVKLNPESLGEVRVVLTSRRGGLDVSLAGGAEARHALAAGAPELQRLLEAVGRADSRITVRDLAGTPVTPAVQPPVVQPPSPSTAGSGLSADLTGGWGTGTGQPGGEPGAQEHPRGGSTAMDGTPAPTTPSRRTETVTQARTGLDVTM
jgi:flagellar hook-length control protein FliK